MLCPRLRAVASGGWRLAICFGTVFSCAVVSHALVLENNDFESGTLAGWNTLAESLSIDVSTNTTFNRNYAARIHGSWSSDVWITNSISQTIPVNAGDSMSAVGFVYWKTQSNENASAQSFLEARMEGPEGLNCSQVWTQSQDGWVFFDFSGAFFGVNNGGFEAGELAPWAGGADDLDMLVWHDLSYEGDYSLKFEGSWTNGWSFNQVMQGVMLKEGDVVMASARVNAEVLSTSTDGYLVAGIKLEQEGTGFGQESVLRANTNNTGWTELELTAVITNSGYFVFRCMVAGDSGTGTNAVEVYFDDVRVWLKPIVVENGGFEEGTTTSWMAYSDQLDLGVTNTIVDEGNYSLRINGSWSGWSWDRVIQPFGLHSGDVVEARGRIYIDDLEQSAGWAIAGMQLESVGLPMDSKFEQVFNSSATEDQWLDMSITAVITNTGKYDFRCMVMGDAAGGSAVADVYFDDIQLWKHHGATGPVEQVTLSVTYSGYSGGAARHSTADIYFDSAVLEGSSAMADEKSAIQTHLIQDAAAVAADPSENDIPLLEYPELNAYGFPSYIHDPTNYGTHTEIAVAGWRFRYLTNDVVLTFTNQIELSKINGRGPGWVEVDSFQYAARNWGASRGAAVQLLTNTPYWKLGVNDNSSAEFGNGPFPAEYTYVAGTSLTNFPRKLVTDYDGQWPVKVNVIYTENLASYDRNWDKYFIFSGVTSNGLSSGVKAMKVRLFVNDLGNTNLSFESHEVHMGWADDAEVYGMVDYPNCTYQAHNEVFLRSAYQYGLVDRAGWFVQQVPRGSATIEPIDLYSRNNGNWNHKVYEEYLFTWPNAGQGVRSIFDDDQTDKIPGPASYHAGYKVGHQYGTNEFGEPEFPGVIEIRGNGYFRMTDYDGVMGGSFRPLSADIFGIYELREDAPVMPEAYVDLVPRTTPEDGIDNSFLQAFMSIRSKTNRWFIGALNVQCHFTPDEVKDTGAYFELESDIYANRALVQSENGKLNAFAQVDMYWRGGNAVDDYSEGHDFDVVMVKKDDGEWVSHHPINPPTNIVHRTLCAFQSNDVLYIMQQDRAPHSYGFSTEAPYRKVSTFEVTMLDDGGRDLSIDLFEQNTISEINDNCVVACPLNEDLAKGDHVHCRYQYRGIYAPGVTLLAPNDPSGGEGWSNAHYNIEFYATDGEDYPLTANLYYGNGKDDDWTLINQGELLSVPQSSHKVSYDWDAASVPPGAYYIKAEAQRVAGGKIGFDISDTRLQVDHLYGFEHNGSTNVTVVTNAFGYLGTNMSFETGDVLGWAVGADDLDAYATLLRSYDGVYSARLRGTGWTNWSWNNLQQEIPCVSGETLHVQGKVFIGKLVKDGTNWLKCGIKMESTNGTDSSAMQEFDVSSPTGVWLNVDFERIAPCDGTDRLLLYAAGYDCGGADIFYDSIKVMSTNTGRVVTNRVRNGYWEGDEPVDISGYDAVAFKVAMRNADPGLEFWLTDADGVTNQVFVTNYLPRLASLLQRVEVPLSDFSTVDLTRLRSLGFHAPSEGEVEACCMRALNSPVTVSVAFPDAPMTDGEGMPHYNPGQEVREVITIRNNSTVSMAHVSFQLLQEYGETAWWMDQSPDVAERLSEKTRKGDRLGGGFETVWTNQTLPVGGSITLTNVYTMPEGKLIDHTKFAIPSGGDWYIFRNYAARAQLHLVIRKMDGDTIHDNEQIGTYSMDDDFDIDDDGLPDYWENLYGGDYTSMHPELDPDGDTYDNLAEYLAGSDPTDPYSYPGHIASYTLHLAYTNDVDLFPRATAEQSNYTGAACSWMVLRYLNGSSFTQTQDQIYSANTTAPEHNDEITPQSCAQWMHDNVVAGYYFSARSRTNLEDALKETVYWMDYLPPGGEKTPVYILCGTNWSYQVVRGFQTDRAPYDGGYGVTTNSTYTIYGMWLNDPRASGLGYDVYATAEEMASIYTASETNGDRWLVAEPPEDPVELTRAAAEIEDSTLILAATEPQPVMGAYLSKLFGGAPETAEKKALPVNVARSVYSYEPEPEPSLEDILPDALARDEGFMSAFDSAGKTNYYLVNPLDAERQYVLAAGGQRGPATTVYVLKLNTNGAMERATWSRQVMLFPPVCLDAAAWAAGRELGCGSPAEDNLLSNPGFEINTGDAGTAQEWTSGSAAATYAWGFRSGSWSMSIASWVADSGYFYQDVSDARPGSNYTFSIWIGKDTNFSASAVELKLEWFRTDMTPLGAVTSRLQAALSSTCQLFRVDGTAPAETEIVRCTLWCGGITGGGALKCDDAMLTSSTNGVLLKDARLVYDPERDANPFMPRWAITFSTPTGDTAAEITQDYDLSGDMDGDGMSDRRELYAGTDPADPASSFGCFGFGAEGSDNEVHVIWGSAADRYYTVLRSTNITSGSFISIGSHIPATPPENDYTDHLPSVRAYYQVEVE